MNRQYQSFETFIPVAADSDFSIYNLPYGIFSSPTSPMRRVCTAIGNYVVDLAFLAEHHFFDEIVEAKDLFTKPILNPFMAAGQSVWRAVRQRIIALLMADNAEIRDKPHLHTQIFYPMETVQLYLPLHVGDYTDFYSSIDHATNSGKLFRDKDNPLLPNYVHLPVGYHGRASSIVVSGTPIQRPIGQILPQGASVPVCQATRALDFELEMAFVVGRATALGEQISIENAKDYIFGLTLLNDWSARDIQRWEYVPLGPFLGKSFATTISPWIVPLEALLPFQVTPRPQSPAPLPYLQLATDFSLDIQLSVTLQTSTMQMGQVITQTNFSALYWTMSQQLAHHTINGCPLNVGDLMASGTISSQEPHTFGSLLEITENGKQPLTLSSGETRTFLENGDTVILQGYCQGHGYRVGFGKASGKICPSLSMAKI